MDVCTPRQWQTSGRLVQELNVCSVCLIEVALNTACVQIPAGSSQKAFSDLGLGGAFRCILRFPPPLTTG